MQTAFITHADCLLHEMGAYHPECPNRLCAINDQLIASGLIDYFVHLEAPLATEEQLARVHSGSFIAAMKAIAPSSGIVQLDPDTAMKAALRAAGAVVLATDLVVEGKLKSAFCSVRPPGHHAERARAMSFCFFNNVAVGVAHALKRHGLERVAVVDFDVHHGNGTENIFSDDAQVMIASTFQHPFYPYSGTEGHSDHLINVPLAAYSGGNEFRDAVRRHWLPAPFAPQMIFFSDGFDAHRDDERALLKLTESDYGWVTAEIKQVSDRYSQGRMVSVLEGGYELHALGRSVCEPPQSACRVARQESLQAVIIAPKTFRDIR
jgi:acetoin utilization deacetylase AcuC-like enzyme